MLYPSQDLPETAHLREEYLKNSLDTHDVNPDPFVQFDIWFQEAQAAEIREPNAMFLATVGEGGLPSGRMVLLKGYDIRGFVFYTNYESRKARHLALVPHCNLTFWWDALERQLRIEGMVVRLALEESQAYFQSRPRGSQIGAWASPQSEILPDRASLEKLFEETRARFEGKDPLDLPPHWGGYRVVPRLFEFWQGRSNRLHDRIVYERTESDIWNIFRLAP